MKALVMLMICVSGMGVLYGQDHSDSTELLEQVIVRAYENNRKLVEVPAAVSIVNKSQLNRFNNISLVPVLNTLPGVRMEERSPGSYRLNIRGSSLRSPFGVRNVKVYYNGIPYTDPGGNSFFNQIGFYNVAGMEVIKGPGGSLYGAGTGGVILLTSDLEDIKRGATVDYSPGSFGTNNFHAQTRGGKTKGLQSSMNFQYQNSDGYRENTKMERRLRSWDGIARVGNRGTLRAHFIQGDLLYQTPGALTASEYSLNPRSARPRVGQMPGAIEAGAAINQKLFLAGVNYNSIWNEHWQSTSIFYGAYSRLLNPTTRNYERRTEPHFGTRNVIRFTDSLRQARISVQGGIESQRGFSTSRVYTNSAGRPDSLMSEDEITNSHTFLFLQATIESYTGWTLTLGGSYNLLRVDLERLSSPASSQKKNYNNELAPRLAILKKLGPGISAYASIARGFSPPTTAEILPSTGVISTSLEAEQGLNTEIGVKGSFLNGKLFADVNAFYFRLNNTIAQRRDAAGADYFVNAGRTRQNGVETFISYRLLDRTHMFFDNLTLWGSHTWHNFHYSDFQKVVGDTADYSGNRLPGVPPHFFAAGLDASSRRGLYGNINYYYSDRIALNDANTDYASSYHLLGGRIGFRKPVYKALYMDFFAMADNIFDVQYSLGNDINAFGGRYYNAAPGRNFSAGISVRYSW